MGASNAKTLSEASRAVERELERLRDTNEAMANALRRDDERASPSVGGGGGGEYRDARSHTLQRHREVLREYVEEHRRLQRDVEDELGREALLGGATARGDGGSDESMEQRLLRERARIAGSTSAVDDLIGAAQNTARELYAQRGILQSAGGKLLAIGSRFPVVNNLVLAIKKKKNKDAMIVAAVVAACTTFVLLYYLSK
jgi:Golgi SNAP receptor complex protein 1